MDVCPHNRRRPPCDERPPTTLAMAGFKEGMITTCFRRAFLTCALIAAVACVKAPTTTALSTTYLSYTSKSSALIRRRPSHISERNDRSVFSPARQSFTGSYKLLMAVEGDFSTEIIEKNAQDIKGGSIKALLKAFYKFCRPHTIRGTVLASVAGTVRALLDTPGAIANAHWGVLLPKAFIGMLALLLGNAFIVGINQIYDVGIDKMNKPFLPVASGEMSKELAWATVAACGLLGPLIVWNFFPLILFKLYMLGWILGAIYSVPPFRTKRNPVAAGLTIATVRGFLLNFGVYYAVRDAIGATFRWSPKVSFIARFMTVFATVIAVTKDLPDTEGDKAFQIETFATKVGVSRLAKGASAVLLLDYLHAIATGILKRDAFNTVPMIFGHAGLAAMLIARFSKLDPESIPSIKKYYKHIWDLFYLEYALYTLI